MKKIINKVAYYLLFFILIIFICSLMNLIGINSTITNFIIFIFNLIAFFILGFYNGKQANQKGYIAGLKIGLIIIFILFLINIFTSKNIITISLIIYYIMLVLSSIIGGMIGIQKKKED